jgi:hypothetical protein
MLLHVLLLILYPLSPALRAYEFVRWFLGVVAYGLEDPAYVEELKEGGEELVKLDRWLRVMEGFLNAVVGRLAADQLGLRFKKGRHPSLGLMPRESLKPLSFARVFARFERLVLMLGEVERLAAARARRIRRELHANPLGLSDAAALLFDDMSQRRRISKDAAAVFSGAPAIGARSSIAKNPIRVPKYDSRIRAPPWLPTIAYCRLPIAS